MNRTKSEVLMTRNTIISCAYVLCLSILCYADDTIKDNGDLAPIENSLNFPDISHSGSVKNVDSLTSNDDAKRASFNAWGGKRSDDKRPKFSSWGGKRSEDLVQKYLASKAIAKKPSFSSWGGKRANSGTYKRPNFSAWGGKRADETPNYGDIVTEKRPRFNSWGGKRSGYGEIADEEEKRRFNSWGGKRGMGTSLAADDLESKYKRPQFSAWGGKRSGDEPVKRPQFSSWGGKRARFNSWGGKRAHAGEEENFEGEEEKRRFNSWGGKRSSLDANLDVHDPKRNPAAVSSDDPIDLDLEKEEVQHSVQKRSVESLEVPGWKRKFNPWAGKRSIDSTTEDWLEQLKRNFNPWGGKRATFNAWGGKRAAFNAWGGKRAGFNAWGGKRAGFNAWGGKRASAAADEDKGDDGRELLLYTLKRQSFRPWGGK